ncbi:TM2 domain-containing protein [Teichococcus vastitatis]|uniref:TM2 domain-containing protein n=1 Tax=Teichococcus vastitatis TaxID=2307076 RepID=A0ABS9W516_9PROT|nr:TM2 domain-containing protein [Pseudoroseomonas vastitatis]MCI0754381.1 TM2 domain-containing protein [Pseudoroseomonas vastitatis]
MALPPDARSMMRYDAGKKSPLIAYLLWFFFGLFGAHRFYAGRVGTGLALLALSLIGFATIGTVLIVPLIWVVVDAFLIPRWIRSHNERLIDSLTRLG